MGIMSGPRGNPGTLAGDEPEGRPKTSPPRDQTATKSFALSTVSSRGTKAGGSMHRDGLAMAALKAQLYRQYKHTGLLFGQLDPARTVLISYETYLEKMANSALKPAPTRRELRTLYDAFGPDEDDRVHLQHAVRPPKPFFDPNLSQKPGTPEPQP